jgi:hypothetical protein
VEPAARGGSWRTVEVAAERLGGWVDRFESRHGRCHWAHDGDAVRLLAPDGGVARVQLPGGARQVTDRVTLAAAAAAFDTFGVVLVRRGGFAVGRVAAGTLSASRCGTRYVQGRTKAGGWSQQRYARRRSHQADAVATEVAQVVGEVLGDASLPLVCGGDRPLVQQALVRAGHDPDQAVVRWLEVGQPRRRVLVAAVARARAARIELNALA